MTEQEKFNAACGELSSKIAKFYDDVEDQTLIICALIPLVAQTVLNVAYSRDASITEVLDVICGDIRICTGKMQGFMEALRNVEGTAQ
jgi:hypothetical protein